MEFLIRVVLAGLYVKLRGRSVTTTRMTDNVLTHNHVYTNADGHKCTVVIHCQQFEHTVKFQRWYMATQQLYTYKVQVLLLKNVDCNKHLPVAHYPHASPGWMACTHYPHYCAINAYVDEMLTEPYPDDRMVG